MAKSKNYRKRGSKAAAPLDSRDMKTIWTKMTAAKGTILERCRKYASWTIPSLCEYEGQSESDEQTKASMVGGAQLVNHLANRIVDTMFPTDRPFFTLPLTPKADLALEREHKGDEVAKGKAILTIKKATARVEQDAMRNLNLTAYRPVAVEAVKHAIVTGGAIIHRDDDGSRSVYGIQDYCAARDLRGNLLKVILRDTKAYQDLDDATRADLDAAKPGAYAEDAVVEVFTLYQRVGDVWKAKQGVDTVLISGSEDTYKDKDFPCLDLTWNLARGSNYPRGLVEDHSTTFHNMDVVTEAVIDLIGIAADIKFLVNPGSVLDISELNASERGSYHLGVDGDISSPAFKQRAELEVMRAQIAEWFRMLSQAFLLNSGTVRDAERVTAEEIRAYARELESAFGGLYSKLALSWQQREAEYLIATLNLGDYSLDDFDVTVATGLESLSREGQLDALRLAISDLAMLEGVPEDIRETIDKRAFTEFVFTNRGVMLAQFVLSSDQLAQKQAAAQAAEQQALQAQGQNDVAVNAAKQDVQ